MTEYGECDGHGFPRLATRIEDYLVETKHLSDMTADRCFYETKVVFRPEAANETDANCIKIQEMTGIFDEMLADDLEKLGPNARILRQYWKHGCPVNKDLLNSFHAVVAESVKNVLEGRREDQKKS